MAVHTYSLRTRVSSPALSVKTPTTTPLSRVSSRSPRKPSIAPSILQLKHIIGTTTTSPSGLSCCDATNSFAYCAGSVAVLATVHPDDTITYRYFKARPTATALNTTTSYFDSALINNTPTKRRSLITPRRGPEESFGREWLDDANGQTWSARERIKAATCVALSPDGKLLAVGETGYNPRVLLFSTAITASTEQPLSIVTDHSIGVRSIAFSPDSKYLATLGDVNDGFLHVWAVSSKTGDIRLHSTNKCTTNICDMTWIGFNIVTVGTRHVKIWHVPPQGRTLQRRKSYLRLDGDNLPSPGPVPLQGRNCLLGKLVDATFTAISPTSEEAAVVCADDGNICKLDLAQGRVDMSIIDKTEMPAAAICFRKGTQQVLWAGNDAMLQVYDVVALSPRTVNESNNFKKRTPRHSLLRESLGISQPKKADVVALGCLSERIISVDAEGSLKMMLPDGRSVDAFTQRLSSHQDLVKGVQILPEPEGPASFFTWARNGEVRFWTTDHEMSRLEQCALEEISSDDNAGSNELRVVRYLAGRQQFITGDRYGVLKLIQQHNWHETQVLRGHSAEITDVAFHEASSLVVTCSRDRMVQLFQLQETALDLIQTLDEHISAVQHVCFSTNGRRLLSCSTDRTVIVRERMERRVDGGESLLAYLSARVITLKASPMSMSLMPQEQDILIVSTMDRHVVRVDVATGAVLEAFKVGDKETDDTSVLNSICLGSLRNEDEQPILVGYSSIDKSIRVYDLQKGNLLGREAGHTEGVSDLALLESVSPEDGSILRTVVSTGLDSTIMIWNLSPPYQPMLTPSQELSQLQASFYDSDSTPIKPSPASLPPLRKVLSKMDMAEFVRLSSPSRESSPHRLRRKTSRLAITASIEEDDECNAPGPSRARSRDRPVAPEKRSPSPPAQTVHSRKPRSRRSPSPPAAGFISTPTTPKHQRANNGRLRRPPSVPADLRAQAVAQQRRQSMTSGSDFGSISMASEQACRMLRTYRKRLQSGRGELDLDEIQYELDATMKVVQQKQSRSQSTPTSAKEDTEVDKLTVLLERTNME